MLRRSLVILVAMSFVFGACSDDDGGGGDVDAAVQDATADDASEPDAESEPDAAEPTCEPATATFKVYDLSVMPPEYVDKTAVCAAGGNHGLVYVDEDIWGSDVTQEQVECALLDLVEARP